MLLCVQRAPLAEPASVKVTGGMRVPNSEGGSEVECNQPLPIRSRSPQPWDPTDDLQCITTTFQHLHASGWYWGCISASEARDSLMDVAEGTFLVRDSSNPHYMLTLSVKTARGPTNVRIEYSSGRFRLDSTSPALARLLSFPTVPGLVQHYVGSGREKRGDPEDDDAVSAAPKDSVVLLRLRRPLHRPRAFPTLQHLARLTIHRHTACPEQLPLPRLLLCYLQDYPFHV